MATFPRGTDSLTALSVCSGIGYRDTQPNSQLPHEVTAME
jgi:hypothetical protein